MFNPDSLPEPEETPQENLPAGKDDEKIPLDVGIDLVELGESIKKDAEKLGERFSGKTFKERVIHEYQTKKPKKPTEEIEASRFLERGAAFRFERGQIYKGYKNLRSEIREAEKRGEDTTSKKQLLKEMRTQAKIMEKDLDRLERQYQENVKMVDVETEFGKFSVPVVELDLKREKDGEFKEDTRTPYFFLPGIKSSIPQSAALSMAMALAGHRVYVPSEIEHPSVKKPENLGEMMREHKDFRVYSEVAKQIINEMGLQEVNIMGHSLGATVALELASDIDFKKIKDLIIAEPLGIESKGIVQLAKEFGLNQSLQRQVLSSESRIKATDQGSETGIGNLGLYLADSMIMARKLYSPEKLSNINPKGRYQLWVGTDSPIMNVNEIKKVFGAAESIRQSKDPKSSKLEFYAVEGGEHLWTVKNALGFSEMIKQEKHDNQSTTVKVSDLENSAMARIIKGIKD
jgi:hypothetical protein